MFSCEVDSSLFASRRGETEARITLLEPADATPAEATRGVALLTKLVG